ncbi:MAG: hypothetical protein GY915_06310 [bacterium]|nr:hypothetical protein [bacterium]
MKNNQLYGIIFRVFPFVLALSLSGCLAGLLGGGGFQIPQLPGLGSQDAAPLGPPIEVDRISLTADAGANEDTATPVEVVFVYEPKVLGQLMKMSAREYFSQKDQLLNDFPNMFISSRWEVPPGRSVIGEKVDLDGSAIGAIVFADYVTAGDHRIRIGSSKRFHIKLGRRSFWVMSEE